MCDLTKIKLYKNYNDVKVTTGFKKVKVKCITA